MIFEFRFLREHRRTMQPAFKKLTIPNASPPARNQSLLEALLLLVSTNTTLLLVRTELQGLLAASVKVVVALMFWDCECL